MMNNKKKEKKQIKKLLLIMVILCLVSGTMFAGFDYIDSRIRSQAIFEAVEADNSNNPTEITEVSDDSNEGDISSLDSLVIDDNTSDSRYEDLVNSMTKEYSGITYTPDDNIDGLSIKFYRVGDEFYLLLPGYLGEGGGTIELSKDAVLKVDENVHEETSIHVDCISKGSISLYIKGEGEWRSVNVKVSSNIPAVFVNTMSGNVDAIHADKEHEESATYYVIDEDGKLHADGSTKIHCRGISSFFTSYKKSYKLKLDHSDGLLGMNSSKKWVLTGNSFDASMIRNKLAYDIAKEFGIDYAVESKFVDLYFNGEYMGNYLLCENANDFRSRQKKEDKKDYLIELTSMYRETEIEKIFTDSDNKVFAVRQPDKVTEERVAKLHELFDLINKLSKKADKKSAYEDISKYLDLESMAKLYLMDELTNEVDINLYSMFYIYDDSTGKIKSGPVWDFDRAWQDDRSTGQDSHVNSYMDGWAERLYLNDEFKRLVAEEYLANRDFLKGIPNRIQKYGDELTLSVEMDRIVNDYAQGDMVDFGNYEADIDYLIDQYNDRLQYVAGNLKANKLIDDDVEEVYKVHVDMFEASKSIYVRKSDAGLSKFWMDYACELAAVPVAPFYMLNGTEVWDNMPVTRDITIFAFDPSVIKLGMQYGNQGENQ